MDPWTVIILIVSLVLMVAGIVGIIVPIIPSTPLIWCGAFLYAVYTGFEEITWTILIIFGALTIFTLVVDFFANIYGAKKFGAGKWGIAGSTIGMIAGTITAGVIGLIVGSFLGAVLFELMLGKSLKTSFNAGLGAFLGFLGGSFAKLVIGFIMIGVFVWKII